MVELDLKGLKCPLPALVTAKRLAAMAPGERLTALCDDEMARIDIPNLCREPGHRLISIERDGTTTRFSIEVKTGDENG